MANSTPEKKKRTTYTTPKGTVLFAHLVSPDYGTEKYPNPAGSFSLSLVLSADDSDRLKAKLSSEIEEAREHTREKFSKLKPAARAKFGSPSFNNICEPEYDKNDEPTGNYRWRFKTGAFVEDKNTGRKRERTVPMFDSLNQRVSLAEEPGNGSIAKVAFVASPYFVDGQGMGGLSLYLNAVQLIKLTKAGERSAEDYGFAEEDGGFIGEEAPEAPIPCNNTQEDASASLHASEDTDADF